MSMADKIAPYVEQGMNAREIYTLHPDWNYKTIYSAMYRIKTGKWNPKKKKRLRNLWKNQWSDQRDGTKTGKAAENVSIEMVQKAIHQTDAILL